MKKNKYERRQNNLIRCPQCVKNNMVFKGHNGSIEVKDNPYIYSIVGEINKDGNLKIKIRNGKWILIKGKDFTVECLNVDKHESGEIEPVYIRKEVDNNEMSFNRGTRFFGYQLATSSFKIGTYGGNLGSQTA